MQITLSFDSFTELPYTSGTVQNISSQATVEICQDDTANTGLILGPGEWFSWSNSTIYARSAWDYEPTAICAVVPFKKGGEGGGGEYILPVASKSTLGGVKSSDEAGAISVDGFGKMTYNAPSVEPISAPDWEAGTIYPANALVTYNDNVYLCLTAHTSGIFANDLANGKWKLVSMTLSVATSSKLGGVKSNSADGGVTVDSDGKMSINLPKATSAELGGVKIGSGLSITDDGTLSATGGGGGGSWQQVTKLNVTAPIDVKIDIPYTDTFILPPVEVLKYVSGTTDVTVNEFTFSGGDGSRFEVDGVIASESPLVTFDGVVKPNHDVKYPFGNAVKMVNKYYSESAEIDLDAFKIVSEVSLA